MAGWSGLWAGMSRSKDLRADLFSGLVGSVFGFRAGGGTRNPSLKTFDQAIRRPIPGSKAQRFSKALPLPNLVLDVPNMSCCP